MDNNKVLEGIEVLQSCVRACEDCSKKNQGKKGMELSVDLCLATIDACKNLIDASKNPGDNLLELVKKCEKACISCAVECGKHFNMQHCKDCAYNCRECAAACRSMQPLANY